MEITTIKCIHCGSEEIVKNGKRATGIQCFKCKKCKKCFQESYINNGAKPETKKLIIKMSVNGGGIRDISRVLEISQNTVMKVLKNGKNVHQR